MKPLDVWLYMDIVKPNSDTPISSMCVGLSKIPFYPYPELNIELQTEHGRTMDITVEQVTYCYDDGYFRADCYPYPVVPGLSTPEETRQFLEEFGWQVLASAPIEQEETDPV